MLQHRTNSEPTRSLERPFYVLVDMCSGFEIDCIFRLMSLIYGIRIQEVRMTLGSAAVDLLSHAT